LLNGSFAIQTNLIQLYFGKIMHTLHYREYVCCTTAA